MDNLIKRVEELAGQVCAENDVALYDVELKTARKGLIVLIYILKIDGVSIENCRRVSRTLGHLLEEEDLFPGRYYLEVSSPGLERSLKLKKHYVSAINEKIKISYLIDGKVKTDVGFLKEVGESSILLDVDENRIEISFNEIKKARTYFEFKNAKKKDEVLL